MSRLPNRRCQCGHRRKHHGALGGVGSEPVCTKCFDGDVENIFHEFLGAEIPSVMGAPPERHKVTAPEADANLKAWEKLQLADLAREGQTVPRGLPMGVVFDAGAHTSWEAWVPPGWAVSLCRGGILISHPDHEVQRILSVRMLDQGEPDAIQDHTQQGQDQAGVDGA